MDEKWMLNKLREDIGEERYRHSLRVRASSERLADHYTYPREKAKLAGLLHDCGKVDGGINLLKRAGDFDIILDNIMEANTELIHGPLGAEIARNEYNIRDKEVLNAIRYHTTGRENMGFLEKIIYIADLIEPERNFPGVNEIRRLAFKNIDDALLFSMNNSIKFIIGKNLLIHPNTIFARNSIIISRDME